MILPLELITAAKDSWACFVMCLEGLFYVSGLTFPKFLKAVQSPSGIVLMENVPYKYLVDVSHMPKTCNQMCYV